MFTDRPTELEAHARRPVGLSIGRGGLK